MRGEVERVGFRLSLDAVVLLDAVVCLFVWVGTEASEEDETL